ncbi:hypothetical protein W911_15770 [Hyphomicrobium nitrativorans NL23]|uniref:C4-dicarboxylate ABC transporter substrate-binding protein n=1 Tax=Hyphomicrobium nitrativorans NL23 TaxID=1029756 RepID=V5SKA1_9HYPH|nr:hypothetical protein [Hyphomicrobium nitrativorans]AHB50394.1 hypothetical protein W911_15770 [Hyphomicrobium nitrativorans NL23]
MDRRKFLISTGGVAVAAAASTAGAEAAAWISSPGPVPEGAIVLRLAMPWKDRPQGPAESARRLAQRFQAMTGGRYHLQIAASAGDADLLHASPHDIAHHHPAFSYFAGLPGSAGLAASDFAHWLTVGGGQMLWDDLAADYGWKPLLAGHLGDAPPLWSRAPITRLSDIAGAPLAVAGLGADAARALGAEVQPLGPDAAIRALGDGTVHAAETGGLLTSLGLGVARVAKHATGHGLTGRGTALGLHVRLDVWDRIAPEDQAILAAAAEQEFHASVAEDRAHERLARQTLETAFGVTFAAWPADIAGALDRVAEATVAHVAGYDTRSARIDQSYMAFRSAVSGSAAPRRHSVAGAIS